jgi:hypothetical protein
MKFIYLAPLLALVIMPLSLAYANEETQIKITIDGSSIINLSSPNKMVRATIEVLNYDPQDGSYIMQVTQLSTQKVVSDKEILVSYLTNAKWGTQVAYLVDEYHLGKDGQEVTGEYEIQIKPELGTAVAKTNFTVIKSSQESEPLLATNGQSIIPKWIKNIFVWYSEGSISESELLDAIKALIQQGIIKL